MHGFCVECGSPLQNPKLCPSGHPQRSAEVVVTDLRRSQIVGRLPKASTFKRLLGSGVEYSVYLFCLGALAILSVITAGVLDALLVPILLLMIALRDVNAGLFSVAKRIGKMRVVEYGSGKPATNGQAFLRNSYYIALIILMIFPIIFTDVAATSLFVLLVVIDVILITITREGRRIGDVLAGTQVVPEAKRT